VTPTFDTETRYVIYNTSYVRCVVEGVMRLLSMPAVYVRSQTLQRPPNLLHAPTLHSAGEEDN